MTPEHQAWLEAAAARDAAEAAWLAVQQQLRAAQEALWDARDAATAAFAALHRSEDAKLLRELQTRDDGWVYEQRAPGRYRRWTVRTASEPRRLDRCEVQEATCMWRLADGRAIVEPGPEDTYTLGLWGLAEDYAITKATSRELRTKIAQQSRRGAS